MLLPSIAVFSGLKCSATADRNDSVMSALMFAKRSFLADKHSAPHCHLNAGKIDLILGF